MIDFFDYFSRNQRIRNYHCRYSDLKGENHCRPVLLQLDLTEIFIVSRHHNLPRLTKCSFINNDQCKFVYIFMILNCFIHMQKIAKYLSITIT